MMTLLFVLSALIAWCVFGVFCGLFVSVFLKEKFAIKDAMICGLMGVLVVYLVIVVFYEKCGDKVLVDFSKQKNKNKKEKN